MFTNYALCKSIKLDFKIFWAIFVAMITIVQSSVAETMTVLINSFPLPAECRVEFIHFLGSPEIIKIPK